MLIHIVPKLYEPAACRAAELLDISIPQCELILRGEVDVVARRPYPNKRYLVACRNKGQKAMHGLLIDVGRHLEGYSVITRWRVNGRAITHFVEHKVLDNEFDTVSDDMILWYGYGNTPWKRRWPEAYTESPAQRQPRMDAIAHETTRPKDVIDELDGTMITSRLEGLMLHTIERERLFGDINIHHDRMPSIEDAFPASS